MRFCAQINSDSGNNSYNININALDDNNTVRSHSSRIVTIFFLLLLQPPFFS
jgi:hypothetical protein